MHTPNSQSLIFLLCVYHILLNYVAIPVLSQPGFTACVCQSTFGNYTQNSTFNQNLKTLLNITSNTKITNGFYNLSVGENLDIVNGIGQCDMDISLSDCKTCLNNAAIALVEECPTQKDAIGWYDHCMLRYSNRYIFHKLEFGPWFHMQSLSYCDTNKYKETAVALLSKLQKKAAFGDSGRKFAAAQTKVSNSCTIHALVQCTPDLYYSDCYQCLDQAIGYAIHYFPGQNARVSYTSCKIRYENYPFYNEDYLNSLKPKSLPFPSPSSLSTSSIVHKKAKKGRRSRHIIIILLSIICIFFLFLIGIVSWYLWRKRGSNEITIKDPGSLKMEFNTIKIATGNFSIFNKLGQGGFGIVYKGKLRNGQAIAVKRLSNNSDHSGDEFKNEAILVARLRHRNLVRFIGYCLEGQERLLIYELLPNKSLDYFLFDTIKRGYLDWQTRYKIIRGIARGLVYLHEESQLLVVHRDLKAGNILLDAEMNPKISDFGMARLFGVDQTHEDTRKICGTFGYMPPEYVQQGYFSFKSDVYSFGVLLIEIISGLRVTQYHHEDTGEGLLSYAWRNWLESTPLNIVDTTMSTVNTFEVLRCINIGLICVQENIAYRPLMSSVVLMLNNHNIDLAMPSRPAFLVLKNDDSEKSSNEGTINEVSVSELDPR